MGRSPGLSSARLVRIRLFKWTILAAPEAFTDPKKLGKRLSNEGHGFSRAVNRPTRLTALAAEVRFSRPCGANYFGCFSSNSHKVVILSGTPHRSLRDTALVAPRCSAQSSQ